MLVLEKSPVYDILVSVIGGNIMAITQEMIDRINELAKKKKTEGLSEEEAAEQKVLYRAYIDAFKANLKAQLEMIEVVDEEGLN